MPDDFIPGLKLSELFYREVVRPLLDIHFPDLNHSVALIGSGSEVLGFDTPMSRDHDWGLRLQLFLAEADHTRHAQAINDMLAHNLPYDFRGYSTNFTPPDPNDNGTQLAQTIDEGTVNHRIEIVTIAGYFKDYLAVNIHQPMQPADWLSLSEQRLRAITAGAVFHDDLGLAQVKEQFAYYPHDVWIYLLACGWARIGQEEHLMGRAGFVGDEIGSALIGSRLVRDVMRLCFLIERTYAPYPKWFGTAFKLLDCADGLMADLMGALTAVSWQEREQHLIPAYETLARMHNQLGLTKPLPEETTSFFGRPFQVMAFHGFSEALLAQIQDPVVKKLAARSPIGSLDQFSDSTDLTSDLRWRSIIRQLY
jgi:hypothetical protein